MSDLITLSCPSCGAQLNITQDIDRFACSHCGQEHIVKRAGGTIALSPVVEAIRQVRTGVDKTAAELAIVRLQKEIEGLQKEIEGLQDENNKFIQQHPRPKISALPFVFLIPGVCISMAGLITISSSPENRTFIDYFILGLFGFIPTLVGGLFVYKLYNKKLNAWKTSTAFQSTVMADKKREIDDQIEKKQTQLKHSRELVSQ